MRYVPGEAAYLGAKNCRYKGRALELDGLLSQEVE